MILTTLLFPLLPLLTSSLPTLQKRAGAPNPKPVPSNCTLTHPHLGKQTSFQASSDFASTYGLYQYLFYPGEFANTTEQFLVQTCLEGCYGYGNVGECRSILLAENVTVEAYGTQLTDTVCTLFSKPLKHKDLVVPAVEGTYLNAKTVDIFCPK